LASILSADEVFGIHRGWRCSPEVGATAADGFAPTAWAGGAGYAA
jgi:hypothetical protein